MLLATKYADQQIGIKLILFCICPFAAFIYSLKDAASRSSYVIYALFGILFCWHMNPTGVERYDDLSGILLYIARFDYNHAYNSLQEEIAAYLSFSDNSPKELYMDLLIWISRFFSDNPHFVLAIAAIPFLFFQLKSLALITDDERFKNRNIYCLLILLLFVFPRDIISVQNPRFATGVWMAVYATIQFFKSVSKRQKIKYLLLIFLTPTIHAAFWVYVGIFMGGWLFFIRRPKISIILLYLSVPFSYFSYDLLTQLNISELSLPPAFELWINNYLSEEKFNMYILHEGASGFFWVQESFHFIMRTTYLLVPIMLWYVRKDISKRADISCFFSFYLFFYAVVNFIQFIPVLGTRYFWLVQIFSVYVFFKAFGINRNRKFIYCLLFACSYDILRRYLYKGAVYSSVPVEIFFMPLPYLIYDHWGITSYDIMRSIKELNN